MNDSLCVQHQIQAITSIQSLNKLTKYQLEPNTDIIELLDYRNLSMSGIGKQLQSDYIGKMQGQLRHYDYMLQDPCNENDKKYNTEGKY